MWRLIIFLLFLIASVWLGVEAARHPGYLLIVFQPWMVQMPLWFALLSFLLLLLVFYLLITLSDRFQLLLFRTQNWLRFRREHQAYHKTQQGMVMLIEGRWKKAERLLLAGAEQNKEALMNYLDAAKAAHEQQAYDRRDHYIQKAYQIAPQADLAIGLTQAELQLTQDQLEHAAATLNHLRQSSPRHPRLLSLLEKVYVRLSDWPHLLALLPSLRKAKVLNAEQAALFEKNIYCEMLHAASVKTLADLHRVWSALPRSMKQHPDVVLAYVKGLLNLNGPLMTDSPTAKEIEDIIRKTIKYVWQPELIMIYGSLPFVNLNRQLVVVGAWLKLYGPKQEILFVLGKLCAQVQLWGKAKDYFEKCLALGPYADASLEYGKLCEELGETHEALQKYREGLSALTITIA